MSWSDVYQNDSGKQFESLLICVCLKIGYLSENRLPKKQLGNHFPIPHPQTPLGCGWTTSAGPAFVIDLGFVCRQPERLVLRDESHNPILVNGWIPSLGPNTKVSKTHGKTRRFLLKYAFHYTKPYNLAENIWLDPLCFPHSETRTQKHLVGAQPALAR